MSARRPTRTRALEHVRQARKHTASVRVLLEGSGAHWLEDWPMERRVRAALRFTMEAEHMLAQAREELKGLLASEVARSLRGAVVCGHTYRGPEGFALCHRRPGHDGDHGPEDGS